jgi:hypothetical protein
MIWFLTVVVVSLAIVWLIVCFLSGDTPTVL